MLNIHDTPTVMIDLETAERNCRKMAASLAASGIAWRPHIKTHKSVFLAKKELEWGAVGVTCSSVGEAAAMARGGIEDIFIAYPIIGEAKLARLLDIGASARLSCLINSLEGAAQLDAALKAAGRRLPVLIEIDGRCGRGGIRLEDLRGFGEAVLGMSSLELIGVTGFCGGAGSLVTEAERRQDAAVEARRLVEAGEILRALGADIRVLSGGSSVSSRFPEQLSGITESRAGTCIFNDMTHVAMGNCTAEDCAVHILSTVITIPGGGRVVLDAGSKTLSSDTCRRPGYGYIVELGESARITALNEEHGMCDVGEAADGLRVGQELQIIPNHVCVAINLTDKVVCREGERCFELALDARGVDK